MSEAKEGLNTIQLNLPTATGEVHFGETIQCGNKQDSFRGTLEVGTRHQTKSPETLALDPSCPLKDQITSNDRDNYIAANKDRNEASLRI